MQGYNVIIVFNHSMDGMLMCRRKKDPYKGKNNFVGGKIEPGENGLEAAYRELLEETGIKGGDIVLRHMMDFTYHCHGCYLEVYVGKLKREVAVSGEENELYWSDLSCDFFDVSLYAGDGNIGYIMEQIRICGDSLFAG